MLKYFGKRVAAAAIGLTAALGAAHATTAVLPGLYMVVVTCAEDGKGGLKIISATDTAAFNTGEIAAGLDCGVGINRLLQTATPNYIPPNGGYSISSINILPPVYAPQPSINPPSDNVPNTDIMGKMRARFIESMPRGRVVYTLIKSVGEYGQQAEHPRQR